MKRVIGTASMGLRAPIIKKGDDVGKAVIGTIKAAIDNGEITPRDRDIVGVTETIVAKGEANYAGISDIARDVATKFSGDEIGILFPILSRNRFAICLRGIAKPFKKVYLQLSFPSDEVGNSLVPDFKEAVVDNSSIFTEKEFIEKYGQPKHPFTGVNYLEYYRNLIKEIGADVEIIISNDPKAITQKVKNVIVATTHTRKVLTDYLNVEKGVKAISLDMIMTEPIDGSGYNEKYGLLGSNKSTEDMVKLFPRDAKSFADKLSDELTAVTGKKIEVLVYGDGAFKDPQGRIWELADPVVSPGFTDGLIGTPNELKLKYIVDNELGALDGEELESAMKDAISEKDIDLLGSMASEGTTPRQYTDLIGSLCDLTSGSGDKGTPIVYIQGYFDNYTTDN